LTAHYASLTKPIRSISPVTHQPSGLGKFTTEIDRRNRVAHRDHRKLHAPAGEEAVGDDEEGVDHPVPTDDERVKAMTRT
jgi:hypothetical protein